MAKLKLLYIEDEPDIREIATMALGLDEDLDVRTAASGDEGWTFLQEDAWRPDVMVVDFMMPGLDGMSLLLRVRTLPAHAFTPVVFVTARTGAADIQRLIEAGAKGVITKPFDPMTLSDDVRALLAR